MNRVVHFEIHAKDMDIMEKFYKECFGWEFKKMGEEFANYRVIVTGPMLPAVVDGKPVMSELGINGGLTERRGSLPQGGEPVNAFVNIVGVENIDETLAKIEPAGGTIVENKMDVPTVGVLAYCKDPEGNLFGIIQPIMPESNA